MHAVSGSVDTYLADHGPLNVVLFALLALVVVAVAVALVRGGARPERPAGPVAEVPAFAPVLPAQRRQSLQRDRL